MTKRLPEFPTDWHQETYIANLKRELEGARVRGDKDQEANALAELRRLGAAGEPAAKKPVPRKRTRSSGAATPPPAEPAKPKQEAAKK